MNTTTGLDIGFTLLWLVHVAAVVAFFSGLVFLLAWAVKTLPLATLKTWALGLLLGGAVACVLTIGVMGHTWSKGMRHDTKGGMGMGGGSMMMRGGDMMGRGGMGMMMDGEGMGMMSNMGMMLEGLEGDAFDEAFIRMMIPHHEGAIDMAEGALESAKHEEMKQLARDIIEAQQREIDMMKGWLTTWGYEN